MLLSALRNTFCFLTYRISLAFLLACIRRYFKWLDDRHYEVHKIGKKHINSIHFWIIFLSTFFSCHLPELGLCIYQKCSVRRGYYWHICIVLYSSCSFSPFLSRGILKSCRRSFGLERYPFINAILATMPYPILLFLLSLSVALPVELATFFLFAITWSLACLFACSTNHCTN